LETAGKPSAHVGGADARALDAPLPQIVMQVEPRRPLGAGLTDIDELARVLV
jgi:hypothetical protein